MPGFGYFDEGHALELRRLLSSAAAGSSSDQDVVPSPPILLAAVTVLKGGRFQALVVMFSE